MGKIRRGNYVFISSIGEVQTRVKDSALSRRELVRRLGTSATQFYRLLEQTNYRKSVDQMLSLLRVLDCDVELIIKQRAA